MPVNEKKKKVSKVWSGFFNMTTITITTIITKTRTRTMTMISMALLQPQQEILHSPQ